MKSWLITNSTTDCLCFHTPLTYTFHGVWGVICTEDSDIVYVSQINETDSSCGVYLSEKELLIKTDLFAKRTIFYYQIGETLYVTNDLRLLFQIQKVPFVVNQKTCAKFLSWNAQIEDAVVDEDDSFFENIKRLGENRVFHYVDGVVVIHKKTDFLSMARKSLPVERSIRETINADISLYKTEENIGIELSGGIDSACILAELLQNGFKPAQIYAFIMSFHDDDLVDTNDIELAKELVHYFGINGYVVYGDKSLELPDYSNMNICNINGPVVSANYLWLQTIDSLCREHKIRVIFTGNGGDELLGGSAYVYDYEFFPHPIRTIRRFKKDCGKRLMKNIYPLLIRPLFFPWKYHSALWGELSTPIPAFFSAQQRKVEKDSRKLSRDIYHNSCRLNGWGRRYLFDFSTTRPGYFEDWFDNTEFANPFYSESLLSAVHQLNPEKIFDISKGSFYSCSKRRLREDYTGLLPESVLRKEIKTTYNGMSKKMFFNSFSRLFKEFSEGESILSQMGIIDQKEWMDELVRHYLICEDTSSQLGLLFRYVWAVVRLESWLRFIRSGREHVLRKSLQADSDYLLCEAVRI